MNRLKRFVAEIQYCFINHWRHHRECRKWREVIFETDGVKYTYGDIYIIDYNPFHPSQGIWSESLENCPKDPIREMQRLLKESITRGEVRVEYE